MPFRIMFWQHPCIVYEMDIALDLQERIMRTCILHHWVIGMVRRRIEQVCFSYLSGSNDANDAKKN
jgi:hypothetical protein